MLICYFFINLLDICGKFYIKEFLTISVSIEDLIINKYLNKYQNYGRGTTLHYATNAARTFSLEKENHLP